MNELLQNFIESLREELKQFGELLALLDVQQQQVARRLADELLATVAAVSAQGEAIQGARCEREQRQRELAQALSLPAEARMSTVLPLLPEVYRPLVAALVDENNQLLTRVRQRAHQNHILLSRAVEMMAQLVNSFRVMGLPTYTPAGTIAAAVPERALYEGVG
jgi:FlgN protein